MCHWIHAYPVCACVWLVIYKKKVLSRLKSAMQMKYKKIRKVLSLYTVNNKGIINYMQRMSLLFLQSA